MSACGIVSDRFFLVAVLTSGDIDVSGGMTKMKTSMAGSIKNLEESLSEFEGPDREAMQVRCFAGPLPYSLLHAVSNCSLCPLPLSRYVSI